MRKDKIKNGTISFNEENSPFNWVDLFAAGPATVISWTSSYSETGVLGEAELATAEKGRQAYEEAVKQLVRFVTWFKDRKPDVRRDRHRRRPTMPMPWGQRPVAPAKPADQLAERLRRMRIARSIDLLRLSIALVAAMQTSAQAEPISAADAEFFEKEIRPLLIQHCHKCHGESPEPKGGLKLTSRAAISKAAKAARRRWRASRTRAC